MSSFDCSQYEELSPFLLLRALPELASNTIPAKLKPMCGKRKAWEMLEDGVFFFFRQILMLDTIKLGANSLFKHEPEGVVLVDRGASSFALLYECKARAKGYRMSSDDTLRYKSYLNRKKHEVRIKYHLPLTHFVIISSAFVGNVDARIKMIGAGGTNLSLSPARLIRSVYEATSLLDYSAIQLLDVDALFERGVLTARNVKNCIS